MQIAAAPLSQREWFTAKEAAHFIGVTTTTLYDYTKMRKNKPPGYKLTGKAGGQWRFPKQEFIEWARGKK